MVSDLRTTVASVVAVALGLLMAVAVNQSALSAEKLFAAPFAIPVLIAASRFGRRGIVITLVLTVGIAFTLADLNLEPLEATLFHVASLLIVGALAILLRDQRQVIAQREREADAARRQVTDVLSSITDAFCALDRAWRFTYLNDEAARVLQEVFGQEPRALLGKSLWEAFPEAVDSPLGQQVRHVMADRVPAALEWLDRPSEMWLEVRVYPTSEGVSIILRDVTRRKRAEEEQERLATEASAEREWLRTVIDRSPVGIILVEGAAGERVNANLQAERLFGRPLPPEGGLAQYVGQIYHLDGTPLERSELATERALHGETVTIEEELLRQPSGREVHVRASAVPIYLEGKIAGAVVIYEDVSRIRELERLREEWTSIIAHDLRQPVTIITGYASLLARRAERAARPEEEARAIGHVLTSARNLSKMIGDLLDVSRIETHRLTIERTPEDLPSLIRAVVERSREITDGHPVRVEITGEIPRLEIDPARIEQVLTNLLSNAAKYSYPNTEIVVTAERRDEEVEVSVTNYGPGIPPEELPRIFTRFYRTRTAVVGREPGLGLGLYISKGLVEAHGGRIWAESTPGQTTRFHFTLPLNPPSES